MGHIEIDEDLCQGTGECAALAGDLVTFDALGIARVTDADADVSDDLAARLVATCPSMAIRRA